MANSLGSKHIITKTKSKLIFCIRSLTDCCLMGRAFSWILNACWSLTPTNQQNPHDPYHGSQVAALQQGAEADWQSLLIYHHASDQAKGCKAQHSKQIPSRRHASPQNQMLSSSSASLTNGLVHKVPNSSCNNMCLKPVPTEVHSQPSV